MATRYIIAFFLTSLFILQCRQKSEKPNDIPFQNSEVSNNQSFDIRNEADIVGTWELRESFSGWGGKQLYPAKNGNILIFTPSDFEIYRGIEVMPGYSKSELIESGCFKIKNDISDFGQKYIKRIYYTKTSYTFPHYVGFEHNRLFLSVDAWDAGVSFYERIK